MPISSSHIVFMLRLKCMGEFTVGCHLVRDIVHTLLLIQTTTLQRMFDPNLCFFIYEYLLFKQFHTICMMRNTEGLLQVLPGKGKRIGEKYEIEFLLVDKVTSAC